MKSYYTDGPISQPINQESLRADVTFNGFAFDLNRGIFFPGEEKDVLTKPFNKDLETPNMYYNSPSMPL